MLTAVAVGVVVLVVAGVVGGVVVVEAGAVLDVLAAGGIEAELVVVEALPQAESIDSATRNVGSASGLIGECFAVFALGSCPLSASCPHASICAVQSSHQPPRLRRSFSPLIRALDNMSPWWEPQLVVAAALGLDVILPHRLTIGANWLLPSVEGALLVGLVLASPHPNVRHSSLRRYIAMALIAVVSAVNIYSLVQLAHYLLHHNVTNGHELIFSGVALWGTNVLLFGLWYFELDRGGPTARLYGEERHADFLFVQMSDGAPYAPAGWTPRLIDYLYTSFTNATAFSPTDTMPLTANAKWLMSAQSLVSFITVGLIVARAVNIL